ncbi:MAG: resolvase, partial [Vulcanococcus sp.]
GCAADDVGAVVDAAVATLRRRSAAVGHLDHLRAGLAAEGLDRRLPVLLVPEAGTTLAARNRYWELEPARGWRRLLPRGLRLPPRDVDDVVAQLLLERHLGHPLTRAGSTWLARAEQ